MNLSVAALGALREDVEDQLGAVEHLQLGRFGDGVELSRCQIAIEDDQLGAVLQTAQIELLELAAADQRARVQLLAALQNRVEDGHSGRARELLQLFERFLRRLTCAGRHPDQHRPILAAGRSQAGPA